MFCSNNFTGWQVAGLDWRCMHRTQGSLCLSYSFTRNLIIYCIYYIHIIFDWCLCMTAARCILIVIEVLIVWSVNICKVLKIYDLQSPNPSCWKNEFHPTMTHHTSKFGHFGRRWNNCDLSPATKLRIVSPHLLTKMERGYFLRWEQLVPNSKGVFPLANPLIFSWNSWGSTVWNSQFLL